ncbi:8993_t:CDS:10 [Entrophospora sp. SA101]|nr:8993_t:CDS:10 [Entrophospora sp. SA101]
MTTTKELVWLMATMMQQQQQTILPSSYPAAFYEDFTSRVWCTYRHNFPQIKPTTYTNDGGWGCMLRSSQSLLANALFIQFLGRDWRRVHKGEKTWDKYVEIIRWFVDDMSSNCPFSVHPFYEDFTSRVWCTYRHNFPQIKPTTYTNDGGWGCMLRSSQSLLANALFIQFLGRDWRRVHKGEKTWDKYVEIIRWFVDDMSSNCPFSVHRIALLGKQLGKNIGEWFGPYIASQVVKALVENFSDAQLNVYIATDGVVYKNDVYKTAQNNLLNKDFQSILILISIRLGINNLNPIYNEALKSYLQFPQSVGIAGGKPSSSYYFIGSQGDEFFYLDPHYSRAALELKSIDEFTEEEMSTYHCETLRKIPISQLDPSMILGFYCRNSEDFEDFCQRIEKINETQKAAFSIAQEAPVYDFDDVDILSDEDDDFDKLKDEELKKGKDDNNLDDDLDDF